MERLDVLCERDPVEHGVGRVVFTPEHIRARERLVEWAREAGLEASVDAVGNFWLAPSSGVRARFLMGSHFDSVPRGGRYDGALGVLLALEIARDRNQGARAPQDVAVVDFVAEESSRFGAGTIGSSVAVGHRSLEQAFGLVDRHGVTFGSLRAGLWTNLRQQPSVDLSSYSGYLEIHVDQATDLLDAGAAMAPVKAIAAPTRWRVVIRGTQAHAGSASMRDRSDALVAAADVITAVNRIATRAEGREVRATVGAIDVQPNVANVIAGEVALIVDLRVLQYDDAKTFADLLANAVQDVTRLRNVAVEMSQVLSDRPAPMNPRITSALQAGASVLGRTFIDVDSWSAHDAMHVASVIPAGMLLVRNIGGVSHSPSELVAERDVAAALSVARTAVTGLLDDRAL
jgi:beta-ureidopropionase / N-carbamoyl-L-amino-acid hydrolase